MAVPITRKVRAAAGPKPVVGKEDYLAYFGRYRVDVENGLVHHLLEEQLFPATILTI
jgi:hypothetical protein